MEFVRKYLDIQKIRFAERLVVDVDIPAHLYPACVPNLVLQRWSRTPSSTGIAKRAGGGAIRIAASRRGEMLCLNVGNDGPNFAAADDAAPTSIGMSTCARACIVSTEILLNCA